MATQEEIQELANRGAQDRLNPENRAVFDELVKRGDITLPGTPSQPSSQAQGSPVSDLNQNQVVGVEQADSGLIPIEGPGGGAIGFGEALAAVGSGAIASQLSKTAGFVQSLLDPFADESEVLKNVDNIRESLTFVPRTEPGANAVNAIGEVLGPVGELFEKAETGAGNLVLEKTGSPTLAGLAATFPTLATEALGFGVSKKLSKVSEDIGIAKSVEEAVPTTQQLKESSRSVFKELDNAGVSIKGESLSKLAKKIQNEVDEFGTVDPILTPKSSRALEIIGESLEQGQEIKLQEFNRWRRIAQLAAKSTDPTDASFGVKLIDQLDEFLEEGVDVLKGPEGFDLNSVKPKFDTARRLWGLGSRGELIQDAIESARLNPGGFDQGIRVKFKQILDSKTKSKWFDKDELAEIRRVQQGTAPMNIARVIGKFGFAPSASANAVGGILSGLAAGTVGGVQAGFAVPFIGTVSKVLANKLAKNNSALTSQVIRAGTDANKIARAYRNVTPKNLRSPQELAMLLQRPDIDLSLLPRGEFMQKVKEQVSLNRAAALGAGAGVAAGSEDPERPAGVVADSQELERIAQ